MPRDRWGPVDRALSAGAEALGYGNCEDHNAPEGTGVSPYAINGDPPDFTFEHLPGYPDLLIEAFPNVSRYYGFGTLAFGNLDASGESCCRNTNGIRR